MGNRESESDALSRRISQMSREELQDNLTLRSQDFTPEALALMRSAFRALPPMPDEPTLTMTHRAAADQVADGHPPSKQDLTDIRQLGDHGERDMVVGGLWCFGGALVTFVTYQAAQGGGTYVVAWGAVVFGGLQFLRGLFRFVGSGIRPPTLGPLLNRRTAQSQVYDPPATATPYHPVVQESTPRWILWLVGIAVAALIVVICIQLFSNKVPW